LAPLDSIEAGAATQVYAATAPELAGKGGGYLCNCQLSKVDDETESPLIVRSYAVDPAGAARLWQISEELVGQSFP